MGGFNPFEEVIDFAEGAVDAVGDIVGGIGDVAELRPHGIDVLHQLPGVGKNLQDHLQARPVFKCRASTINTETKNMFQLAAIAFQYALNRSGPMAMAASLGTGFLKTRAELE